MGDPDGFVCARASFSIKELPLKFAKAFMRFVDALNEKIGEGISWLASLLVLVVCFDVFTRYLLKRSSVAVQELEWHLFAVIFLIAAAYTLKHDRHVRVDVVYMRLKPETQAWINFIGSLVFLLPFCLVGIWSAKHFVVNSFLIGETSPDPGGLPYRYVLKSMVPIGFFLLSLQGVSLAVRSWLQIKGIEDER